jgi:ABC-type multidrug transport system fused ATPase/permease subunit
MLKKNRISILIDSNKKIFAISVIFIFFILTIIDLIGIGAIVLFVKFFFSEKIISTNIIFFDKFINNYNQYDIILFGALFIFVIFVIKNFLAIFLVYLERSFFNGIATSIQKKIYDYYLLREFKFFSDYDPGHVIRIYTTEVENFRGLLRNCFLGLKEIIMVSFIISILFYINFTATLILVLTTILSIIFFYYFFQKSLKKKGTILFEKTKNLLNDLNYTFQLLKEIKLNHFEKNFRSKIFSKIEIREKAKVFHQTVSSAPRYLFEVIFLLILFLICFYALSNNYELSDLRNYIIFLVIGGLRMLPSINAIQNAVTAYKFYSPSAQSIYNELKIYEKNKENLYRKRKEIEKFETIELKNLGFSYHERESVIKNISIKINKGDKIAVVGPSGSGKTTLIHIILGFLKPTRGKIIINGNDYTRGNYIFKNILGYVSQNAYLVNDSIKKNILFFNNEENAKVIKSRLKIALDKSNASNFINSFSKKIHTVVGDGGRNLSGGQQQRISIARSLINNPSILILDEPTSNQDYESNKKIIEKLLNDKTLTIIMISHNLVTKGLFNKILDLKKIN